MKWLIASLLILICVLQYNMWIGAGSRAEVKNLRATVVVQKNQNRELRERNDALLAEVDDLMQGVDAIEERARAELGMIKRNETFFQIVND